MFWIIFELLMDLFILAYLLADIILTIRNIKYQKLWYKEKATRLKIDPNISRAELCEFFVMFCKRNNCKVEF